MLKNIIFIAAMSICMASQSEKVYEQEHKKIANCATLSYVSPTVTWKEITDTYRYLGTNGFYYIRIEFENKYIAFTGDATGLEAIPVGRDKPRSQAGDDIQQKKENLYVNKVQENFLSIHFPRNPNDKIFQSELQKFSGKQFNIIMAVEEDMTIQCIFQVMDTIKTYIDIERIIASTITK